MEDRRADRRRRRQSGPRRVVQVGEEAHDVVLRGPVGKPGDELGDVGALGPHPGVLEVERLRLVPPGDPGVERGKEPVVPAGGDRQAVDDDAVDLLRAGRVVVGPVDVAQGTAGDNLDPVAPGRQPGGELPGEELGAAGHLPAVALDDEQEPPHGRASAGSTLAGTRALQRSSISSSQAKCSCTSVTHRS